MMKTALLVCLLASLLCVPVSVAHAGDSTGPQDKPDKAAAYYHFALGHLYAELAGSYGAKGDYLDKAIDNYRKAMRADPSASFLSEELSDLYIQAGRLREAVVDAEEALKKDPDDLSARRILGRIYIRLIGDSLQGRVNEEMVTRAIEQYVKISEKLPDDPEVWLTLGRLYTVAHNSVESESAFQKALELDPDSEDALTGLAIVYSNLGDHPRAAEVLRRVVGKNPSFRTLTALANSYEQMREYSLAIEIYRRALELSPRNTEVKRALAQNLLLAERLEDSLAMYEELVSEEPRDFRSLLRMFQIYRRHRNFDKAREALEKAKQIAPDDLEVRYNEVSLLESEDKTAEAIAALRDILDSTEKSSYGSSELANRTVFLERLGLMCRANEQYADAIGVFRELLELDSELGARVAAQISDTYRQAKQFARAEQEIEAARKKYPEDEMVGLVRATILADLGKADEAVAAVEKLMKGRRDRDGCIALAQIYEKTKRYKNMAKAIDEAERLSKSDEEKATVLFMRGAMHERRKQYDEAEAAFRKVLALSPDNASAMNYLGYMFADRNLRLAEAHELISRALKLEPHNGAYLDSLGWVYYRMDKPEEAEDYLLRAVEKVSRDPVVHDHLGDLYFRQDDLKKAIEHWEISLKEWDSSSASEKDPAEVAKIQKKLEGAEVRLAKESSAVSSKQP